jgi:hypothetical protein
MAPTFRYGSGAKLLVNARNLTPFIKEGTVSASLEVPETTTWGKSDKEYLPGGIGDITASFDGLHSKSTATADTITNYLDAALGGSTNFVTTFGPEGDSTGRWAYLFSAIETKLDVDAPAKDVVGVAFDMQGSGGLDSGVWLRPLSTRSSTASNSAVVCAGSTTLGGTTGGGVGHLHITVASTVTSITTKIQHSTSGSTWADLISWTSTAETVQRSTVSGTVKEQLRFTISSYTGGAAKTVTCAAAFARRGKLRG